MEYIYEPQGVCSQKMVFEIEGNIVKSVKIVRGCPGNTVGVAKLIEGLTIDEIIKNSLINWTIDRVSKVNLTIVRLAIAEMLYINDVPEVVAINEAIELTKKYSDDKSVSFVNGALDKAFKNIK